MRAEAAAKYAPAMLTAPLGALDPVYASIAFGMLTGLLAIIGVMVEQQKPAREIVRALIVSLLIGGGGALFAAFAAAKLHLDPLGAAVAAFGIAFGGVRTIKTFANAALRISDWLIGSLLEDAADIGRKRRDAARIPIKESRPADGRLTLTPDD